METLGNLRPGDRVWFTTHKGPQKATVVTVPDPGTCNPYVQIAPDFTNREWTLEFYDLTPLTQEELYQEQAHAYIWRDNVRTAYTDPDTGEVFMDGLAHETALHLKIKDGVVPDWLRQMVCEAAADWISEEKRYLTDRLLKTLADLETRVKWVKAINYGSQHDILIELRSDRMILEVLNLNKVEKPEPQE